MGLLTEGTKRSRRLATGAAERIARASQWLKAQGRATEVLLVGATRQAVVDLARTVGHDLGGSFGWHRLTLVRLAWALADMRLAEAGRVPVSSLAFEAVCARVVHAAAAAKGLGRFAPIADRPGLPRALAHTFTELLLGKVHPTDLGDGDLAALFDSCVDELERARLVDQSQLFAVATEVARHGHPLLGHPLLLLDVPITAARERELLRAVLDASESVLCTVATGDERTLSSLRELGLTIQPAPVSGSRSALGRLQAGLFVESQAEAVSPDESVTVFSAPGEGRECVEIVRRIHREAERGVPFDRMAVVLRSPLQYRAHLQEAFRRGGIPAYFARGVVRPDPSGRAFLALLTCAAAGLSATGFAEFLSLGEVPDATNDGGPPPAMPSAERWVPSRHELLSEPPPNEEASEPALPAQEQPVVAGTLRAPRLWERLIVDAAVIGGLDRWERRLEGLRHQFELALADVEDADDAEALRLRRDLEALAGLTAYALPLLASLDAFPRRASWGEWLDRLGALATRALKHPERVLAVLAELAPMETVGPVELREVRLVLERRLTDVAVRPAQERYGRVFVASTDDVRGLAFDAISCPGWPEKLFPQRVVEDPIVPDRARTGTALPTNRDRAAAERLALRLAVGPLGSASCLSYPRLDVEQSRPRTPSFYGLEVLRAAEGKLPGFDELA